MAGSDAEDARGTDGAREINREIYYFEIHIRIPWSYRGIFIMHEIQNSA